MTPVLSRHHVDHELVETIEEDSPHACSALKDNHLAASCLTMGGVGPSRTIKAIPLNSALPLIQCGKIALFSSPGRSKGQLGLIAGGNWR
jgi:hypothetical protein